MPRLPSLATAVAVIANKSLMLVCENPEGILELPGLTVASNQKALQHLEVIIEELDVVQQPQQTLYLSQFTIGDPRQKPVAVLIRIVHVETTEPPSFLDGKFLSLAKLQLQQQASPLVKTVAQWLSNQWSG